MYPDYKVNGTLNNLPGTDEVKALESLLDTVFPVGYSEYVTRFGSGVLGGSYIRIYTPSEICEGANSVKEWRQRVNEYWFWGESATPLSKERAQECIILGDTLDGDELCFHEKENGVIYVLPRNKENIFIAGKNLVEAIEWLCSSGILTDPFTDRVFEPNT